MFTDLISLVSEDSFHSILFHLIVFCGFGDILTMVGTILGMGQQLNTRLGRKKTNITIPLYNFIFFCLSDCTPGDRGCCFSFDHFDFFAFELMDLGLLDLLEMIYEGMRV